MEFHKHINMKNYEASKWRSLRRSCICFIYWKGKKSKYKGFPWKNYHFFSLYYAYIMQIQIKYMIVIFTLPFSKFKVFKYGLHVSEILIELVTYHVRNCIYLCIGEVTRIFRIYFWFHLTFFFIFCSLNILITKYY